MNYIDKDIKDHEDYIEFTTFNKFNIKIFFTKKHYGSIPERSKEDVAKDFYIFIYIVHYSKSFLKYKLFLILLATLSNNLKSSD